MRALIPAAEKAASLLKERGERIAIAETSAGGLVSAALLAVPGASAYFAGGAITYSPRAVRGLLGLDLNVLRGSGIRSSSEPYAALIAREIRLKHGAGVTWGVGETGAAGPGGNGYGDPSGHTCMAVDGPVEIVRTLRTGIDDRVANMELFAAATLALMIDALEAAR